MKELLAKELSAPTTATTLEYASQNISSLLRLVEHTLPHGMPISTLDACAIWADEDLIAHYVSSLTSVKRFGCYLYFSFLPIWIFFSWMPIWIWRVEGLWKRSWPWLLRQRPLWLQLGHLRLLPRLLRPEVRVPDRSRLNFSRLHKTFCGAERRCCSCDLEARVASERI